MRQTRCLTCLNIKGRHSRCWRLYRREGERISLVAGIGDVRNTCALPHILLTLHQCQRIAPLVWSTGCIYYSQVGITSRRCMHRFNDGSQCAIIACPCLGWTHYFRRFHCVSGRGDFCPAFLTCMAELCVIILLIHAESTTRLSHTTGSFIRIWPCSTSPFGILWPYLSVIQHLREPALGISLTGFEGVASGRRFWLKLRAEHKIKDD